MLKKNKGFTLLELLIVVAIIGLLIAIAIPAFQGVLRRARDTTIKGSLDGLITSMKIHEIEHGDFTGFCASTPKIEVEDAIVETGINRADITCIETPNFVAVSSPLHTEDAYWVVTSAGEEYLGASLKGLVGYWRFDGSAQDVSKKGNHGTLHNFIPVGGNWVDRALSFDGVDDYVEISNLIDISGGYTIEAWLYFRSWGSEGSNPIPLYNVYVTNGFWVHHDPTGLKPRQGGSHTTLTGHTNQLNVWTHEVYTWDGSTFRSYQNGELKGTWAVTTPPASSTNGRIGMLLRKAANDYNHDGLIDEVRIYNRALSADEIKAQFETGR